jgi:hypothetical protein
VAARSIHIVARLAWILPVFFLLLTPHQAKVAYELYATLQEGTPAEAEIVSLEQSNRVDVTYDYAHLRVTLDDGRVIEREKMSLPHSIATIIQNQNMETVEVRVRPGANQEIVLAEMGRTQWQIAAMNAAMAFFGAVVFGVGVWWWNRYLRRQGDPSERGVTEGDANHPAREIVRER